jgi:hypothetical protein
MIFLVLATVALAAYFGYLAGVRRERGRAEHIAELVERWNPPQRRGVRLKRIKVRR